MTELTRMGINGHALLQAMHDFFFAPAGTVTVPWTNSDGTVTDFTTQNWNWMWSNIKAIILDKSSETFYVDAVNGDNNNDGSVDSPFMGLQNAIDSIPYGGKANIYLKSDIYANNDYPVVVTDKYIDIFPYSETPDVTLHITSDTTRSLDVYSGVLSILVNTDFNGSVTTAGVFKNGHLMLGGDLIDIADGLTAIYVRQSNLIVENTVKFGNDDSRICTIGNFANLGFNNIKNEDGTDMSDEQLIARISGILRDADSGNPVNLISNRNLSN